MNRPIGKDPRTTVAKVARVLWLLLAMVLVAAVVLQALSARSWWLLVIYSIAAIYAAAMSYNRHRNYVTWTERNTAWGQQGAN